MSHLKVEQQVYYGDKCEEFDADEMPENKETLKDNDKDNGSK